MTVLEANNLIQNGAGDAAGETWADLGAGEGTFTLALAQLVGEQGSVIAVDNDAAAIRELRRISQETRAPRIDVIAADLTRLKLPDIKLDGALLANVLHFIEDPTAVLTRVRQHLRPGGRLLVVEYDRRARSNWVPFPLPMSRLDMIASAAGLATPVEVGRRKSRYQGELYCALLQR